MNRSNRKVYRMFYEGETTVVAGAGADTVVAEPTVPATKTFTQAEVDTMMATNKRTLQDANRKMANDLEQLKANVNLTAEEKTQLEQQIEQLKSTYTTEAQLKEQDITKLQTKLEATSKDLTGQIEAWRSRFQNKLIEVDIASAASEYKAYSVEQLTRILAPITKVIETLDGDKKPSGEFSTQVDFTSKDKDGKPVVLKLSVSDAVKAMTQLPERYGNLFTPSGAGGLGGNTNQPTAANIDLNNMSVQDYKKNRDSIRQGMAGTHG